MRLLGALLLVVLLISFVNPIVRVEAAQEALVLSDSQAEENQKFQVPGMVPGGSYTQTFRLQVADGKNKSLGIRASVMEGSKMLADALQISVTRVDTQQILYTGLVSEMSWAATNLTADTQEVVYEVTVYTDSAANNDFQDEKVTVDLTWKLTHNNSTKTLWIVFCVVGGVLALAAAAVGFIMVRKSRQKKQILRIVGPMAIVAVLLIVWSAATLVLAQHQVTVGENAFTNGVLKINLNDGKPVFDEEILFEPGMLIRRNFTISNEGNIDVIYRLWMSEIEGTLAEDLQVEIKDGKKMIFSGILEDFMEEKTVGSNAVLLANETKELTIEIFLPEDSGNDMQGTAVSFRLNYDATQKEGNPNKDYE